MRDLDILVSYKREIIQNSYGREHRLARLTAVLPNRDIKSLRFDLVLNHDEYSTYSEDQMQIICAELTKFLTSVTTDANNHTKKES